MQVITSYELLVGRSRLASVVPIILCIGGKRLNTAVVLWRV